jgi:hypothetical protein
LCEEWSPTLKPKSFVWRMNLNPKLKMFVWRMNQP